MPGAPGPSSARWRTAATPDFVELAERVSGQPLDTLFRPWLYDNGKPELP